MARIYCKKCGLRGDSKCPHCRSIFADEHPDPLVASAMESIEAFVSVRADEHDQSMDGKKRHHVSFWTYAQDGDEAIRRVLNRVHAAVATKGFNITVASCVHEWSLMPGEKSEIGCGHVGPPNDNVPADPYAEVKERSKDG